MDVSLRIARASTAANMPARPELTGETASGVLYVSVTGVVTVEGIFSICAQIQPALGESSAVCLDYSRALLAVTDRGLDALFQASKQGPSVPIMAWVTPDPETAVAWERQAMRFALVGLSRFATHRPQEAHDWVRRQAMLAAQQQAWRKARP
jgi:hypothetical protein